MCFSLGRDERSAFGASSTSNSTTELLKVVDWRRCSSCSYGLPVIIQIKHAVRTVVCTTAEWYTINSWERFRRSCWVLALILVGVSK